MSCIITGCALRMQDRHVYAWGDLFLFGDRFVFNANTEHPTPSSVRVNWYAGGMDPRWKIVTLNPTDDYWERRGVFVMPAKALMLNQIAKECVGEEVLKKVAP